MKKHTIKGINLNGIGLYSLSLLYMYISIFIFIIGWIRPILSIPTVLILLLLLYKLFKNKKNDFETRKPIVISIKMLISVIFVVSLIGVLLGWTGTFFQTGDWVKHNKVLHDLSYYKWPVFYHNGPEDSMLTYYLGQYMVGGLFGKIWYNVIFIQIINGIWAIFGLLIAVLNIFKIVKADTTTKQIKSLIIILLFSPCLFLSKYIGKIFIPTKVSIDPNFFVTYNNYKLQYSSNITLLHWVMPQVIIPWIVASVLYDDKENISNFVLIGIPVLFYSSLPFLFLAFLMFILVIINYLKTKNLKKCFKNVFSLSNVLTFISIGLILLFYFRGNLIGEKPDNIGLKFIGYKNNILIYLFFIVSFIPYTIILFNDYKKNVFFIASSICLLLLPFASMGLYNDFVMRVSIIPLFIYMLFCIKFLLEKNKKEIKITLLLLFLIFGSYSSLDEFSSSSKVIPNTQFTSLNDWANRLSKDISDDMKYNYFTYYAYDSFFYRYIAKR